MSVEPAILQNYTPKVIDKWLHVTQDGYTGVVRYHSRNAAIGIRAIFIHVQEGKNWGSWQHFHTVKASSTVLIGQNGDIWRLVPEDKAPWTNGDVQGPDQTAIALMNRFGWDPNTWCLSIENEGYSGGLPYTEEQLKSNVWQIWQWLKRYPTIEEVHILRHGQVNSVTRSRCPEGSPYIFMQRIQRALLNMGTPGNESPTDLIREPWPVLLDSGKAWDGKSDVTINGIKFYAETRTMTVRNGGLNRRQWASTQSNLVGTPSTYTAGTKVKILGFVEGQETSKERRWAIGQDGSRLWAGGFVESLVRNIPVPVKPDDGVSQPDQGNNRDVIPVVLNGNVYTPVGVADEAGKARKQVRTLTPSNTRLWASTHSGSPVKRTIPANTIVHVTHWVKGEKVSLTYTDFRGKIQNLTSDKWYVIEPSGNADPITKGERIWAGLVEDV